MGLNNNKLVLAYGFNQEEVIKIGEVIIENGVSTLKVIDKDMLTMKIGDIIEGLKITTASNISLNEKVILFNNFEDEELQTTIKTLRGAAGKDVIFAIVTETSIKWTFAELLEHLVEEKRWANKTHKRK